MAKPKIEEIQYLRAFAFLAVVVQHSIGHYFAVPEASLADGVLMGLILLLAKFAVPLFIFITGLVLFYNYDSGVRFVPFVRKRCKDILLPYLPWAILYAVMFHHLDATWTSIRQFALDVVTGTASYHLWYIVMIFQFYLLFPLLQRAIVRADRGAGRAGFVLLALLGLFYIWYIAVHGTLSDAVGRLNIPVLSDLFTTYDDRNALHFFYYFLLGAAAGLHLERWKTFLTAYRVHIRIGYGIVIGILLYVTVAKFQLAPQLKIQYNTTLLLQPLMALFLIVSVVAMHAESLAFAAGKAPRRLREALDRIGSLSYVAYLAHALVLNFAVWAADGIMPGGNVTLRMLAASILCAAGAVALAFVLRRVKLLLSHKKQQQT
ncbi:acyltransferase [Gordoniibacillus kamchatkensis]|uniref:acyltransferase n=1 Tax=Gordoniibacillus kamchatkensis TaxID=1590651 RepID=UPI000697082A|nr:acyltransferase [Paenibacillus sp. VKM B-2647]